MGMSLFVFVSNVTLVRTSLGLHWERWPSLRLLTYLGSQDGSYLHFFSPSSLDRVRVVNCTRNNDTRVFNKLRGPKVDTSSV